MPDEGVAGHSFFRLQPSVNLRAQAQSPEGYIEPIHPSEINPNSDSRSRTDVAPGGTAIPIAVYN